MIEIPSNLIINTTVLDMLLASNDRIEAEHHYDEGISRKQAVIAGYLYFAYKNPTDVLYFICY